MARDVSLSSVAVHIRTIWHEGLSICILTKADWFSKKADQRQRRLTNRPDGRKNRLFVAKLMEGELLDLSSYEL